MKKLGADHPDTLTSLNNLAGAYMAAGKLPQALPLFEQAAAGIEKRNYLHEYAERIIRNTIRAYEAAGQFDKADTWRRKWLAVVKQKAGAESIDYANELAVDGLSLLLEKKYADAEPILRECLGAPRKTPGETKSCPVAGGQREVYVGRRRSWGRTGPPKCNRS